MSTATARPYQPYFAGRFMPSETRKCPQNRAFYGHRDTYSGKSHCIKDSVLLDPCMGSGHILVYAFDVLMQIYEAQGYTQRDAARLIVEKNLYGLDIDKRAYQLAYFAVMMKARQYNRRILNGELRPHLYAIQDSNGINRNQLQFFGWSMGDVERNKAVTQVEYLLDTFRDAKEYGSILSVDMLDWALLYRFAGTVDYSDQISMDELNLEATKDALWTLIEQGAVLAQKYEVVVTNPPYMGSRKSMNPMLKKYVEKYYIDSKSDLYTVFIEKNMQLNISGCFLAMVTQQSFMFTDDYKELRSKLLSNSHFINMMHLGADSFPEINGEVVQTTSFVLRSKVDVPAYKSLFLRLVDFPNESKIMNYRNSKYRFYCSGNRFKSIKANPFSYWLSDKMRDSFSIGTPFEEYGNPRAGITTGDNDRFMRAWYEVSHSKIGFHYESVESFHASRSLYIPYNKGGKQVRWYGNNDYVLMFDEHNYNILSNQGNHLPSRQYYCLPCITWSDISGRSFAARYCDAGSFFDVKGSCGFPSEDRFWLSLAFLNSKLTPKYIESLNPTTTTQVGDLKRIPVIPPSPDIHEKIDFLAKNALSFQNGYTTRMKPRGTSSGIRWCEVIIMYKKLVEYDYTRKQPILSDKTPYRCRFCEEIKGPDEFKKIAHAVAECIGNKAIISSYECDKCNHRFSAYESELGKLYTFYRANRSIRKKGGGKTKLPGTNIEYSEKDSTYSETINLTNNPYDCILVGTYKNGTDFFFKSRKITVNGPFVYRALLKFSLSIAPENLCSYLSSGFHILKKDEIFSQPVLEIVRKNIISKPKIRLYQYDGAAQYPRWFSCIDVFQITYILFLDFEMQPNFLPYPIIAESIESPIISPDDIFAIQIRDFSRNVTIEQAEQVSGHIKY